MGVRDWFFSATPSTPVPIDEPAIGAYGTPQYAGVGGDLESLSTLVHMFSGASVSRSECLKIPALKRASDLVCDLGSILPLQVMNDQGERVNNALISQPENPFGLTASYTWTNLLADIWWHGKALFLVDSRSWTTYPSSVVRVPFGRYQELPSGDIKVDGKRWNSLDCIVFRGKEGGMLSAAGPTVRALQAMTAVAAQNLNVPTAREYFRSTSNVSYTDEQIDAFLDQANTARRASRSGWLPPDVSREEVTTPTAQEMMLIDQQNFGVLQVSRLSGISPSWLGVPVVDKTYNNAISERRAFIDLVAMPTLKVVSDRLSLGDCLPSTQKCRWQFGAFLQADLAERYASYEVAIRAGFLTINECRELENRPPLPGGDILPSRISKKDGESR